MAVIVFIAWGLLTALGRSSGARAEYSLTRFYMDTFIEITVIAPRGQDSQVMDAINHAFAVFETLEKDMNFYDSKSYLYRFNRMVKSKIENDTLYELLVFGLDMAEKTGGAFDPTLGALKNLYRIGEENPVPPDEKAIAQVLKNSGFDKIRLEGRKVEKPERMLIDLGGILKGHAVDMAAERLSEWGYDDFFVNGGGNIRAHGVNMNGEPWRIGVENPRGGGVIAVIPLNNQAVATSGDYQRYYFYNGERYHHIFDSKTGKPGRLASSATVTAPDARTADCMSTAVFIMGRGKGIEYLENMGLSGIIVDDEGFSLTDDLKNKIWVKDIMKDK